MTRNPGRWVLLRGLGRGHGHGGVFAKKLQLKFSEDQFEFMDLPGNGTQFKEASPCHISAYVHSARARSRYRFPKTAPGKVQFLGASGDRLVHPTCTQKIATAWGVPIRMHPDAGHDLPVDDPEWVLDKLL